MLQLKTGHCIDCSPESKDRRLIAGRCDTHYWLYRRSLRLATVPPELLADDPEFLWSKNLRSWYFHHISVSKWICENCLIPILPSSIEGNFASQAHILPKEIFPSVKLLVANHLNLGAVCGCHQKWDHSWATAFSMPVFEGAREKFLGFKHLLSEDEIRRIPILLLTPKFGYGKP